MKQTKRNIILSVAIILCVILVVTMLELTNTTHWFHKDKFTAVTASPVTKGISSSSNTNGAVSKDRSIQDQASDIKHPGAGTPQTTLKAPIGTFANIYKAKVDAQMTSDCGTNSGATCKIIFTNGDVTKTLPAQLTDRGGGTSWSWTPKDIGLTPGTWHIVAEASLGGQVKTTSNDPLTLVITQ